MMIRLLLLLFLPITLLFSSELDSLLQEYSQAHDLSSKTKNENSGHLVIFTRNDLDKMQAKNLNDVLKSTPAFTYEESRYNVPDMYNMEQLPFRSNSLRLYIDNQEISTAIYGSGMALFGDIPLGFVDHIEIYMGTPSYKFSTETAFVIVKLYSKDSQRESGGIAKTMIADDGYNQSFINYIDHIDDLEYQIYTNYNDNRQDKQLHKSTLLSKDKEIGHFFAKLQKDDFLINLHYLEKENDTYINRSLDATPEDSLMTEKFYSINFEKNILGDYLKLHIDYNHLDSNYSFRDDNGFIPGNPLSNTYNSKFDEDVTTVKFLYERDYKNHALFSGIDYRKKEWSYRQHQLGPITIPSSNYDEQNLYSIYFQDEYELSDHSILTFGYKRTEVENNGGIKDQDANNFRVGHIYTTDAFTFKTYYNDSKMTVEPYLISSNYGNSNLEPERIQLFSHETSYETASNKASIMLGYSHIHDAIMYNYTTSRVYNESGPIYYKYAVFRDEFQVLDFKNYFSFFISQRKKVPTVNQLDYRGGTLRTFYTYEGFDLFSEVIYRKNDESKENYFDLSLGFKKELYKDVRLSFKAENILNDSYATTFNILRDPNNVLSSDQIQSEHSPKRFLISLEYRF